MRNALTLTSLLSLVVVLVACGGARPAVEHPETTTLDDAAAGVHTPALAALLRESWEAELHEDPFLATLLGDHRFDGEVPDLSREAIARRRQAEADELARARAIESEILPEDRVTYRLFVDVHESAIALHVCEGELWNDSPVSNLVVGLNQIAQLHSFRSAEDVTTYVSRVRGFARMFDQDLANLRAGAAEGRVAPRTTLERLIALVDRTVASPAEEWTVVTVALESAAELPEADRARLRSELLAVIESDVRPAMARFGAGLTADILPHGRDAAHEGVASMPQGEACYAANIRHHTSTVRTAAELHALGEREVAATDARMIELGHRLFGVSTLPEVIAHLRGDASLGYATSDAILEDARARVAAAEARAPEFFAERPEQSCEVVAIPEAEAASAPFAYYFPGAPDGSRGGMFFVNTADPTSRRRHMLASLTAHEAVPGHHFQISIAQTLPDMPAFRRHGSFTAYVEGWGLYAERLADEMGLYHDDLDRLGATDLEAFRSARLVVDTGMHAMGWSRTQAEDYLRAHTSMPDDLIANEVDRYLNWPGQALAYKVGQIELLALRAEAEAALGDRFDRRAFHALVLGTGAVTMPVLGEVVRAWIAEQSAAPTAG
jgi:uncharacterized protein (DUF885 family)